MIPGLLYDSFLRPTGWLTWGQAQMLFYQQVPLFRTAGGLLVGWPESIHTWLCTTVYDTNSSPINPSMCRANIFIDDKLVYILSLGHHFFLINPWSNSYPVYPWYVLCSSQRSWYSKKQKLSSCYRCAFMCKRELNTKSIGSKLRNKCPVIFS